MNKPFGINAHFPTLVYYAYDVVSKDDHQKIINKCDELRGDILEEKPAGWFCDVKSSYHKKSLANTQPFRKLILGIERHIKIFCQHLDAHPSKIKCDHAWINASGPGQFQEEHTHPNSNISAIYYLKAPDGAAGTIFKNPFTKHSTLPIKNYKMETTQETGYAPEPGKLLLFESFVPHLTEVHGLDKERMTFAANFTVK